MRQQTFVLIATLCFLSALVAELGADSIFPAKPPSEAAVRATLQENQSDDAEVDVDALVAKKQPPTPPGLAIPYLALFDGLLGLSLVLMTVGGILNDRARRHDGAAPTIARTYLRVQNVVLLGASLLDVVLSFTLALLALAVLIAMLTMFLAAPFGTIAYLLAFGFFDTGRAAAILTAALVFKIVATVLVVLGGQVDRRLLLRLGLSMGLCVLVAFLHGFPPGFLVSIVDALTAIVVAVVALVVALQVLFGSIVGTIKSLRV